MSTEHGAVLVHNDRRTCITAPILLDFAKKAGHSKLPRRIFALKSPEGIVLRWKKFEGSQSYDLSVRDRVLIGGFKPGSRMIVDVGEDILEIKTRKAGAKKATLKAEKKKKTKRKPRATASTAHLLKEGTRSVVHFGGTDPKVDETDDASCDDLLDLLDEEDRDEAAVAVAEKADPKVDETDVADAETLDGDDGDAYIAKFLDEVAPARRRRNQRTTPSSNDSISIEAEGLRLMEGICADVRKNFEKMSLLEIATVLNKFWPDLTVGQFMASDEPFPLFRVLLDAP